MKNLSGRLPWCRGATIGCNSPSPTTLFAMFLLLLVASSLPAAAGTVNMKFNGLPTGNNYSGVSSYPYDLSVNGGPNQWMMCIGYREHISGGETWRRRQQPALVAWIPARTCSTTKLRSSSRWRLLITVLTATSMLLHGGCSKALLHLSIQADSLSSRLPRARASTHWVSSRMCSYIPPYREPKAAASERLKTS